MPRACKSCRLGLVSSTREKGFAAWAVSKRDAPSAQDEMCACTQARTGRCLGVGYKLVELHAVWQDGTRQWIKQRERYVIVIVTVCGTKVAEDWKRDRTLCICDVCSRI